MKLFTCIKCNQIFNLTFEYKECDGGHGGGQYVNNLYARIWGDKSNIVVLGFANSSFTDALRNQLNQGDSKEMFNYGGSLTPRGREFTAFVIPEAADSVERVAERFAPIKANLDRP